MVELLRKLALTSILSLIAPGSAGQVVVGLLLAFLALLVNMRLKPYAEDGLNFVSQISQLNLFLCAHLRFCCCKQHRQTLLTRAPPSRSFLFVALLLKVNLDGEGGSQFFAYIVGFMSIVPIALPILIRVWLWLYGNLEAKMVRLSQP